MKDYKDYTEEELDSLYDNLSEELQYVLYGDTISETLLEVLTKVGTPLDVLGELEFIITKTILGIIPASLFRSQVVELMHTNPVETSLIIDIVNKNIFNDIRDSLIHRGEKKEAEAIYDEALDELEESRRGTKDPYREDWLEDSRSTPLITEDKLGLVDEIWKRESLPTKELTKEDGSIRVSLENVSHQNVLSMSPTKEEVEKIEKEAEEKIKLEEERRLQKEQEERRAASGEAFSGQKAFEENLKKKSPFGSIREDSPASGITKYESHLPEEFKHSLPSVKDSASLPATHEENLPAVVEKNTVLATVWIDRKNPQDIGELVISLKNSELVKKENYKRIDPYKELS
jgi:hypothetical protein